MAHLTTRQLWRTAGIAGISILGACGGSDAPVAEGGGAAADAAALVNVFRGTQPGAPDQGTGGGAGNTFPGPVVPFGMIKLGPDTLPAQANFGGGYAYDDDRIRGFSLTRFSGAGCWGYRDVPIMPTTAPINRSPARPLSSNLNPMHVANYSHDEEEGAPGYYRVTLNPASDAPIDVELTAATRAAQMRVTFPENAEHASLLFDLGGSVMGVRNAEVTIDPERGEISGSLLSGDFCFHPHRYRLHFVARFDRPIASHGTWRRQLLQPGGTSASDVSLVPPGDLLAIPNLLTLGQNFGLGGDLVDTASVGAWAAFDAHEQREVTMRVAISFVSRDNARANLDAEAEGVSFDAMRANARARWNDNLERIQVEGGSEADRRTFYTSLYHALIHPTTFTDANGEYMGMDAQVHVADGYTQITDLSGWDIYRAHVQLLSIIAPERARDLLHSLIANARESGWLPKWPVGNGHTGSMTGDPAPILIASAHALGVRDFDTAAALAAMVRGGTELGRSENAGYVQRPVINEYLQLGYVPHERNANQLTQVVDAMLRAYPLLGLDGTEPLVTVLDAVLGGASALLDAVPGLDVLPVPSGVDDLTLAWGSAGTTIEYAKADFAIASLAGALGETAVCEDFLARSGNWRNVFDPDLGAMRPKWASGLWLAPYDPAFNDIFSSMGFAEGNGVQYTWSVGHDPAGLIALLGGQAAAVARLSEHLTKLNDGFSSPHAFLGNEPSFYTPWLFNWMQRPDLTQATVRRVLLELFNDGPGGYPGNDDLGTMSAYYIFSALGFYPFQHGQDTLALSAPLFPRITLRRARGDIVITAPGASHSRGFVAGLRVNGGEHERPWLPFTELVDGGRLDYVLADTPQAWGSDAGAAPPSFSADSVARLCLRP
ncbi:GH92 family glycosyl hydrolase [Sinimarinibacterium flocculans]|uniref:Putative alpha-1,2-mannosidase n=1 Tax=Sinimarinibacterium flocculans TaxID=985250 RepID=A0A318E6I3_9GAMM|nr:GH92 family glycosyl hydrolase [Sinimarinibacterium flocculans]PXV64268.1 putative alpha-1,2-mannosidase [Sinimarinibacterium flocculans]